LDSDVIVEITCTVGSIIIGWDFTNSRTDSRTVQGDAGLDLDGADVWALGNSVVCGFVYETVNSGAGYTVVAKNMALKNYGASSFIIKGTAAESTGGGTEWTAGASANTNVYKLASKIGVGAANTDFTGAVTITSATTLTVAPLVSGGWVDFDLQFTAPTAVATGGPKSIILTLVAE
jgi:hypothetical protein